MEKVRVVCSACGSGILVPAEQAGRSGKCPKCGATVQVPAAAAPEPAADLAPPAETPAEALEPAPEPGPARTGRALAAAAGAGLVGAAGWALLLVLAAYEIGWLAWGIGGLVGWAAVRAGGRGQVLAGAAALVTVLAIFGGKMLGYALQIHTDSREMATQEALAFDEYEKDAADWAALTAQGAPAPDAVRAFMAAHDYAEGDGAAVDAEQLDSFLTHIVPMLAWFHAEEPTREEFAERSAADLRRMIYAESSLTGFVLADLNGIDALFAFLGISTAFGLVKRASPAPMGSSPAA